MEPNANPKLVDIVVYVRVVVHVHVHVDVDVVFDVVVVVVVSSPRAESARAVTGGQCPHSGVGEDFLARRPGFFLFKKGQ